MELDDRMILSPADVQLAPLNWQWLAGFFQAEGSRYTYPTSGAHYLTITQKDKRTLISIQNFLAESSLKCSIYTNPAGISQLTIHSKQAEQMLQHVFPLLRGYKRNQIEEWSFVGYDQLNKRGRPKVILPWEELPIDYDFLVGFYEGDGSITYDKDKQYLILHFYNKDTIVLDCIKAVLDKGWTRLEPRDEVTCVSTYANAEDLRHLLASLRTLQRYEQLLDKIMSSESIRLRVFGESDV